MDLRRTKEARTSLVACAALAAAVCHAGALDVAEAVEKVDPEVTITTLAYQYSVTPPKFVKPRRNVLIVLCDIGCDFSRPFGVSRAANNPRSGK